jgi:hypothetical protein
MATIAELIQTTQFPGLLLANLSKNWTILANSVATNPSSWEDGYFGVAYYNTVTGEVVIANRGTQTGAGPATFFKNLFSDAELGLHVVSQPQNDAIAFAQAVANKIKVLQSEGAVVTSVIETGHSLGGTEAQDALAFLVDNNVLPPEHVNGLETHLFTSLTSNWV